MAGRKCARTRTRQKIRGQMTRKAPPRRSFALTTSPRQRACSARAARMAKGGRIVRNATQARGSGASMGNVNMTATSVAVARTGASSVRARTAMDQASAHMASLSDLAGTHLFVSCDRE